MRFPPRSLPFVLLLGVLVLTPGVRAEEEKVPAPHKVPDHLKYRALHTKLSTEGGSAETETAVKAGLEWLARHQNEDGYWDADNFMNCCGDRPCDGAGRALHDVGVTGLSLLAFLADGQTYKRGKHRETVKRAVKYLKQIQDPDGCFGPRTSHQFVYSHAIASLAWIEVYAMTGSDLFKPDAERGVKFILRAQNPGSGWRYGVRPSDNDSSITAWMVTALFAAREAGLEVPDEAFAGATKFFDKVTDAKTGQTGYVPKVFNAVRLEGEDKKWPPKNSASLTALGLLSRIHMAKKTLRDKNTPLAKLARARVRALPPRWESKHIDMYYWYYGTQLMHQCGGKDWKDWNAALKKALLPHQDGKGCENGSWPPEGPWGKDGGRVYSTALCTLMLQSYYRYARIAKK